MTGRRYMNAAQEMKAEAVTQARENLRSFKARFEARKRQEFEAESAQMRAEVGLAVQEALDAGLSKRKTAAALGTTNVGTVNDFLNDYWTHSAEFPAPNPLYEAIMNTVYADTSDTKQAESVNTARYVLVLPVPYDEPALVATDPMNPPFEPFEGEQWWTVMDTHDNSESVVGFASVRTDEDGWKVLLDTRWVVGYAADEDAFAALDGSLNSEEN